MGLLHCFRLCFFCLVLAAPAFAASSASYVQDADVFSSGGGASGSSGYATSLTVGQSSPLGEAASTSYINHPGFWHSGTVRFKLEISTAGTGTGTVSVSPGSLTWTGGIGKAYYNNGTTVTLTATPDINSLFAGWTGDSDCSDGSVGMNSNRGCIATFSLATFTVTPQAGTGGSISPNTPQSIVSGATASFIVTPDSGYQIASVTGCGGTWSGSNPYVTAAVYADCTVSASFSPLAQYSLSITKRGNGLVTSSTGSIDCGSTCSDSYTDGAAVTLTPTPDAGWNFVKWEGDADCSDGSVTMTSGKSCKAVFAAPAKIGVFIDGYWYLDTNMSWDWNGTPLDTLGVFGIGLTGAIPVAGDWNGDGRTEIGVYMNGTWYLDMNNNWQWDGEGTDVRGEFGTGLPNAIPVVGDWNGNGTAKIGIYSNGNWFLDVNSNWAWDGTPTDTYGAFGTGLANPVPVTGDWNGDGITKIGIYTNGTWYLDVNNNWAWDGTPTDTRGEFGTGLPNAVPVTGDWNGNGTTKIGIYSDGNWYLDTNASWDWNGTPPDTYGLFGAGLTGETAVTGNW